jgi:hypothetical protein
MTSISTTHKPRTPAKITRDFVIDMVFAANQASDKATALRVEINLILTNVKLLSQSEHVQPNEFAGLIRNLENALGMAQWVENGLSTADMFGGEA